MSPIVLALEPGIPCAGRVELAGTEAGSFHLLITTTETWTIAAAIPVELVGGSAEFSAEGIPPGTYEAQLHSGEGSSTAVRFELGPSGDRELRLVFTPLPERSAAVER
jgi:hypothetical protein